MTQKLTAITEMAIAFDDDILYALLCRWVSELEPMVFRNHKGFILGLGTQVFIGQTAVISVHREQLSIDDIRAAYEVKRANRRRYGYPRGDRS